MLPPLFGLIAPGTFRCSKSYRLDPLGRPLSSQLIPGSQTSPRRPTPTSNLMDGIDHVDPFLWDVQAVSRELCSPDRPWSRDPNALAQRINEEEIDGKTLLIYEHIFSRKELMESLGIKIARQKAALVEQILSYQARSKEFHCWKKGYFEKNSPDHASDTQASNTIHRSPIPIKHANIGSTHFNVNTHPIPANDQVRREAELSIDHAPSESFSVPLDPTILPPFRPESEQVALSEGTKGLTTSDGSGLRDNNDVSNLTGKLEGDDRPLKKRRLAPINLSSGLFKEKTHVALEFTDVSPGTANTKETHTSPYAYLGSHTLDMHAIKSSAGTANPRLIEFSGDSFVFVPSSTNLPPGMRLVVARTMKKILLKNARQEMLAREGIATMRSPTPSDGDILELDDLPDDWDEQTRKEMEEEKAEIEAREREQAQYLSQERVDAILQEALSDMKTKWEEKKLPRYQRRAYKLWTDATKRERTKRLIFDAQREAELRDGRIKKLLAEILKDKWQKEQHVRDQAIIVEQNLDDKLYYLWLVGLLESRVQPEKPDIVPRPRDPSKTRPAFQDEEVLTSSDEMDDFVVNDEETQKESNAQNGGTLGISRYQTPSGLYEGGDEIVDLTQIETPEKAPKSQAAVEYIDLTTTPMELDIKSERPAGLDQRERLDLPPSLNHLEGVEIIGDHAPTHWAKLKDRWRMLICMIFRLEHARRQSILALIQNMPTERVWLESIQLQMSNPLTEEPPFNQIEVTRIVAFDLTKIFLSFIRCRPINDGRIRLMDKKVKSRLERSKKGLFPPFCAFIREMAPRFPQDNQILRVEALGDGDDDIALDEFADEAEPSTARRRPIKEVVQNKDAVDLREREVKRIEEQEARRMKLRAALAKSDFIANDKSRLIINESKQEDQALIYVNEDIGRRIKDHQINGVRFLWNQVIRDVDVRQGCLLAHTMGLGKTMQVITFLVAIREAAASTDASVRSQVPEDLRASQTLILCPSGLVDNWVDEVLLWAPKGLLGDVRRLEASMAEPHRLSTVRDWAQHGGLLIIGYDMFKRTCNNKSEDEAGIEQLLIETPSIVIADEAHTLKNPNTQINQVCAKFRTRSRIALTGTPLSNNVEEYYSMINWVAPNFLGPQKEFRDIYSNPIQQGLWSDSGPADKREALKMMEVLKRTVAPKIDRATISRIKGDLPSKYEFVLFVTPTPLQKRLYDLFMDGTLHGQMSQARIFSILSDLTLICNHPRCFREIAQNVRRNPKADTGSSLTENMLSSVLRETNVQDLDDPSLSQKVELLLLILDEARRAKEKVLVFSQSIPTLNYLENLLTMQRRLVCRLDGKTKISIRQDMVKTFNSGDREVYLISSRAGGMGLNIQGANRVVIFDIKWNPVIDQQAIGRAYRIGQQKPVYVYHFLVAGTFEEVLHNKAVFKMQLASRLVDKKNPVSWGKRFGILQPVQPVPAHDISPFLNRDSILDKLIRHKPNGEVIRQILSTDTFEEEDANSKVTPEMNAQIEEFMKMESIRLTDPARYERMQQQQQEAVLSQSHKANDGAQGPAGQVPGKGQGISTIQGGPPGSSIGNHVNGAYNHSPYSGPQGSSQLPVAGPPVASSMPSSTQAVPSTGLQSFAQATTTTTTTASSQPAPVPLPMTGANTYFREAEPAPPMSILPTAPTLPSNGDQNSVSIPKRSVIFGPVQSQAKVEFQSKLARLFQKGETSLTFGASQSSPKAAEEMTAEIDRALKERSQGFLHDNLRWNLLTRLLDDGRFLQAVASGILRPDFLAMTKAEEVERRVSLLKSLSDEEAKDQLHRMRAPDPSNLGKIGYTKVQSARAMADLAVMKQTADKRRQRGFRLPPWANEALARGSKGP